MPRTRSSRAPVSLQAVAEAARAVPAVQDRIAYMIPLEQIHPSRRNPRQRIDNIEELAQSIKAYGLLQPIVVRRNGNGYELVAGHRRFEAVRSLNQPQIAAVVRDETTEDQAYLLTLTENLQREDLTPKEEAAALEILVRENNWSTRKVGEAIHKSAMYVSKRLRVFDDPVLFRPVLDNQLTVSTAEELLLAADDERAGLVQQAIDERWGWAQARQAVRERKGPLQSDGQVDGHTVPTRELLRAAQRLRTFLDGTSAEDLPARAKAELRRLQECLTKVLG